MKHVCGFAVLAVATAIFGNLMHITVLGVLMGLYAPFVAIGRKFGFNASINPFQNVGSPNLRWLLWIIISPAIAGIFGAAVMRFILWNMNLNEGEAAYFGNGTFMSNLGHLEV